jgi:hypothetical protein
VVGAAVAAASASWRRAAPAGLSRDANALRRVVGEH